MDSLIVFKQMIILLLIMFVGFILAKTKTMDESRNKTLSKLVIYVFNPALIISCVSTYKVENSNLVYITFLIGAISFLFLILVGSVLKKLFADNLTEQRIYQLLIIFTNVGFMGIPVIKAIFDNSVLIYIAVIILEYNVLLYTYGMTLVGINKGKGILAIAKNFTNIGFIACAVAMIIFILKISLPEIIELSLSSIADCATPISMIVIGVSLGCQKDMRSTFANRKSYLFIFIKMLVVPVIGMALFRLTSMPEIIEEICIIEMAMPCGSVPMMLVQQAGYNKENTENTGNLIILSTVMSVVTIPIVITMYNLIH